MGRPPGGLKFQMQFAWLLPALPAIHQFLLITSCIHSQFDSSLAMQELQCIRLFRLRFSFQTAGRLLSRFSTLLTSQWEMAWKSVPLGKY